MKNDSLASDVLGAALVLAGLVNAAYWLLAL